MLANGEDSGQFEGHALWRRAVGNRVCDGRGIAISRTRKRNDGRARAVAGGTVRGDCFREQAGTGRFRGRHALL